MKNYHILFTGVGRRVELIGAFRQAALALGMQLTIYGTDVSGTAPALAFCDCTRKVCGMREDGYVSGLAAICKEDKINLIIPTIDTDLLVLSQNRELFEAAGTKVLISSPDMIAICRDKNKTHDFFVSCGLKSPRTVKDYQKYESGYPAFIKPKDGSGSIHAYRAEDSNELEIYARQVGDYIIQPFIDGTEYTIDIFCDFGGNVVSIVPRVRLAVRSGEVLRTEIDLDGRIIREAERLVEYFKPCGPLTVQLIRDRQSGDDYFIEINPRFGGGAPLGMKAGARTAEAVLGLLAGAEVGRAGAASDHAVYSRFDQSVCMVQGKKPQPIRGIVFDLDDTLYSEKEYVQSGFRAVAQYVGDQDAVDKMWRYFESGKPAIDEYLERLGKSGLKNECLEVYRSHRPRIRLYEGVAELVEKLKIEGIRVGIITDGRPEGQRNKIAALGLEQIFSDIIITDELGGVQFRKPNDISFRILQCRWCIPFEQMIYVGDNLSKDFQAPWQLGMRGIWFRNEDGLYTATDDEAAMQYFSQPAGGIISEISEMADILKSQGVRKE